MLRLLAVSAVSAVSTWARLREGRVWALAQREGRKSNQGKWMMERVGGDGVSFSCCAPMRTPAEVGRYWSGGTMVKLSFGDGGGDPVKVESQVK